MIFGETNYGSKRQVAAKKVYCIDTGLSNAMGFGFLPNTDKLLENLVFLALPARQRTAIILRYYLEMVMCLSYRLYKRPTIFALLSALLSDLF